MPPLPAARLLLLASLLPAAASAADDARWAVCGIPAETVIPAEPAPMPPPGVTDIQADQARLVQDGVSVLQGNVVVRRDGKQIESDSLRYDQTNDTVTLPDTLRLKDETLQLDAAGGEFHLKSGEGAFHDAQFELPAQHARGAAERLETTGQDETRLQGVTYTTCPPGDEDWLLHAGRLRLDHAEGLGYGRNVWISFMHVPLFYTPWLSFPLDDRRRSGILPPTLGNTARSGFEFQLPYYWNIAPQLDATFTPRYMSDRGTQLLSQFRFLTENSNGELNVDYLPDDQLYNDSRYRYDYRQINNLPADFRLSTSIRGISDDAYFEDLGENLRVISRSTHQPRQMVLSNNGDWYRFNAQVLGYQIVDPLLSPGSYPYYKLPAITFNADGYDWPLGLEAHWDSEIVNFQQDDRVSGLRADFKPVLELPLGGAGWFVTPRAGYRFTSYQLEQPDGSPLDLERSAPITSLDAGLFLERPAGENWLQTLEPRLYYLNVPYRDQSAIPRFDTSEPDLSFYQLFSDNRFIGPDRLGDANQVTAALTTRLLDTTDGRELFAASLGRIRYFEDRRVQLSPATPDETRDFSGIITELRFTPDPRWSLSGTAEWDEETRHFLRSGVQFQYRPGDNSVYNLGYRLRRGEFEQVDASFAWPITRRISLYGRWYHDLTADTTLETFGGLQYESCCWIVRLVSRRFIYNRAGDTTRTLFLQLELKGLGSVGRQADDFLRDGIYGYGIREFD